MQENHKNWFKNLIARVGSLVYTCRDTSLVQKDLIVRFAATSILLNQDNPYMLVNRFGYCIDQRLKIYLVKNTYASRKNPASLMHLTLAVFGRQVLKLSQCKNVDKPPAEQPVRRAYVPVFVKLTGLVKHINNVVYQAIQAKRMNILKLSSIDDQLESIKLVSETQSKYRTKPGL